MNLIKDKIVFLTDSLSLPRNAPEIVTYEETYVYLLKQAFPNIEFIQFAYGGATINELKNQADYIIGINPSIVILQTGIVDCAPRTLTKFELDFIHRIPFISSFMLKIIRKNASFIRNIRKITYTKESVFKNNLIDIQRKFNTSKVYAISIIPACAEYEKKVPGVSKKILSYNSILNSVLSGSVIDTSDIDEKGVMSDFFHLNKLGHQIIFNKLKIICNSKI